MAQFGNIGSVGRSPSMGVSCKRLLISHALLLQTREAPFACMWQVPHRRNGADLRWIGDFLAGEIRYSLHEIALHFHLLRVITVSSSLVSKCRSLTLALDNLGFFQTAFYAFQRFRHRFSPAGHPFVVYSKRSDHRLYCRAATSDAAVFSQIFVHREYRCLDDVPSADFIIDCGANVGYSAAYFLTRYPESFLLCIEPDPGNFVALESNLRPYRERAKALRAAVWSGKTRVVLSDEEFRDGREWARTVREATEEGNSSTIEAIDIGSLIREYRRARVSILKIDIEGAEAAVFSKDASEWIDKVDNLVIELHGPHCEKAFHEAIDGHGYTLSRCDELTVCKRNNAG